MKRDKRLRRKKETILILTMLTVCIILIKGVSSFTEILENDSDLIQKYTEKKSEAFKKKSNPLKETEVQSEEGDHIPLQDTKSHQDTFEEESEAFFRTYSKDLYTGEGEMFNKKHIPSEELGKDLVDKYGYKLFLKGLEYDDAYINWYSAYRLIEFYNEDHKEEILLELAVCSVTSEFEEVKMAANFAMDVLSGQTDVYSRIKKGADGSAIFTRFFETQTGGGQKIYSVKNQFLQELLTQDDPKAGVTVKDMSISPNGHYLWVLMKNDLRYFAYVLPLETVQYPYRLRNLTTIQGSMGRNYTELANRAKSLLNADEKNTYLMQEEYGVSDIQARWTANELLEVQIAGEIGQGKEWIQEKFTYNPQTEAFIKGYESEKEETDKKDTANE